MTLYQTISDAELLQLLSIAKVCFNIYPDPDLARSIVALCHEGVKRGILQ